MKLTNMAMSAAEAKKLEAPTVAAGSPDSGPKYPYGLEVRLDNESLKKLGIESLPKGGTEMLLVAKVNVCGSSSHTRRDGSEDKNLELQITDMQLGEMPRDQADAFYKDKA